MGLHKTLEEIFKDNYVIPLYQRNFAWREEEIECLLQDIYQNFRTSPTTNYYIGSLIVLNKNDGTFEVIDGQQRLTVISLLAKIIGLADRVFLSYDSRPEVISFLKNFYKSSDLVYYNMEMAQQEKLVYFSQAIDTLLHTHLDPNDDKSFILAKQNEFFDFKEFKNYIKKKVILVRVEVPQDTDVASYFEIMNNRGEQLQKHEILKSLMMSTIKNKEKQNLFSKIWTACSQMDTPIQKLFSKTDREIFFGNDYDDFISPACRKHSENIESNSFSINDVFNNKVKLKSGISDKISEEDDDDESTYKSIIDFPNFIMHVFKICYDEDYIKKKKEEISLDEKFLLSTYDVIKGLESFDAMEFAKKLLFFRTCMERFVIFAKDSEGKEDNFEWVLQKPYKYFYKKKKQTLLKFKNTFENDIQDSLIKALSMLQVTFRTRKYKNWLQDVLRYFNDNKDLNKIEGCNYLHFLHTWMEKYFDDRFVDAINEEINEKTWEFRQKGTQTPHFLFNFIDYLYWYSNKEKYTFSFKYHNSIEHHLPQSYKRYTKINIDSELIDNLGNLCLVSKSANSKMGDRLPLDKSSDENKFADGNIGPKRLRMRNITNKNKNWAEKEILEHYTEVIQLLNERKNILGVD